MKPSAFPLSVLFCVLILLTSCTRCQTASSSAPSPPAAAPSEAPEEIAGTSARITGLEVSVPESDPVQVRVTLTGYLSDGCTRIRSVTASRTDQQFEIALHTERPAGAMCTQALVPFTRTIALDVQELSTGTYTVQAGDRTGSFTLSADNMPSAP